MSLTVTLLATAVVLLIAALTVSEIRRRRTRRELQRVQRKLQELRSPSPRGARAVKAMVGTALDAAAKVRDVGVGGAMRSSLDGLLRWSKESQLEMAALAGPDGTVTIAFSDIENSTALNEQLGDATWVKLLDSHDRLVRATVAAHHGHIIKSQGDGFMVAFSTASDAVFAALAMQDAIAVGDRRLRRTPLRIRVGIHTGTAIERDGDLFGRDVAHAARVAALAGGGEVLVSDAVRAATAGDGLTYSAPQRVELKGLSGEHLVWNVSAGETTRSR